MTLITITILISISTTIMMLSIFLSYKSTTDQEKLSPFECGFNPLSSPRIPFSIRFFLIAMIFLIFDVEIILLLPLPLSNINTQITMTTSSLFIIILLIGLFHEWKKGALNWAT